MSILMGMVEILHDSIPTDLIAHPSLPGVRPLTDISWLRVDEAYAAQMRYRRELLSTKRHLVLAEGGQDTKDAASEALHEAMKLMPQMGFSVTQRHIYCPDGTEVDHEADGPLAIMGKTLQEDICIMQERDDEHVLTAAVLCFPASWTLSEKLNRPLIEIHEPVEEYDQSLAKRVQRLFDGVRVEQPMWRNNMLRYHDPNLFQPRSEHIARCHEADRALAKYVRAERQCIVRLPQTRAVVFSIHSYVAAQDPLNDNLPVV